MFKRLCIIGVGLIGGSIARSARGNGLATQIVGLGGEQQLADLETAKQLGVLDEYYLNAGDALQDSDFVIIATPVGAVPDVIKALAPHWQTHTIYSDACSTKQSVISAVEQVFGYIPDNYIPAHPIAGAERSGVTASSAELFKNRRLILTPLVNSDAALVAKVKQFWENMGSSVSFMSAEHHDTILAATSHFPHLLAFALVGLLGKKDEQREIFKYAAGGFKDFSRIASSDPTMWLDICIANKKELIPLITQFQQELSKIQHMLVENQPQAIFETFTYARNARQRFLDQLDD